MYDGTIEDSASTDIHEASWPCEIDYHRMQENMVGETWQHRRLSVSFVNSSPFLDGGSPLTCSCTLSIYAESLLRMLCSCITPSFPCSYSSIWLPSPAVGGESAGDTARPTRWEMSCQDFLQYHNLGGKCCRATSNLLSHPLSTQRQKPRRQVRTAERGRHAARYGELAEEAFLTARATVYAASRWLVKWESENFVLSYCEAWAYLALLSLCEKESGLCFCSFRCLQSARPGEDRALALSSHDMCARPRRGAHEGRNDFGI